MSAEVLSVSATDPDRPPGIGQALALSGPGATIVLRPGVYRETFVISGDATVVAADGPGTVVIDTSAGTGILVTGGTLQLRDIEVRGGHPQTPMFQVTGGALQLDRCDLRAAGVAAVHVLSGALRVRNGSVSNSKGIALVASAGWIDVVDWTVRNVSGTGIFVSGDTAATFQGCAIADVAGAGVIITGASEARFQDCQLSQIEGPAVVVQETARPHFQDLVIEGGQVGLYITDQAAPTLQSCRLLDSMAHGVMILDDAAPVLVDCSVEDASGHGVHAAGRASGQFTRCRVLRSGAAGMVMDDGASVTFTKGDIVDCADAGALMAGRSAATLDQMTMRGNPIGVSIEDAATPILRSLRIRDGRCGVQAVSGGGHLEEAEIRGCDWAGVRIAGDSALNLRGNQVRGAQVGVLVTGTARVTMSTTRIDGCEDAGLVIEEESNADVDECTLADSRGEGVRWEPGSSGVLRDCKIIGNRGVGVLVNSSQGVSLEDCTVGANGVEDVLLTVPRSTVRMTGTRTGADGGDTDNGIDEVQVILDEMHSLVGLDSVKHEIATLVGLHRVTERRVRAGLHSPPMSWHLVLAGPPGTGKSSVARLYGRLLAALGVLRGGQLVEMGQADLVADGLGGTATKTAARIEDAFGGVLFIDLHTLNSDETTEPGIYTETVDTLTGLMERQRDELIVLVAGSFPQTKAFLAVKPGLEARFRRTVEFGEYSSEELVTIVDRMCHRHHYVLEPATKEGLRAVFDAMARTATFGNGRVARQLFDEMLARQAYRLARTPDVPEVELVRLLPEDLPREDHGGPLVR